MTGDRAALAAVRSVLRGRRGRPAGNDLAYGVYLAIMLTIIAVAPTVRAIVLGLAAAMGATDGPWGSVVAGTGELAVLAAALTCATALFVFGAAHTGPAHAKLPAIDLLHTAALSRSRLFAGPVSRALLGAALLAAGAGAVLAGARAVHGGWATPGGLTPELALALVLGGAALGLLTGVGMLLGQASRRVRAGIVTGLAVVFFVEAALRSLSAASGIDSSAMRGSVDPWSLVARVVLDPAAAGSLLGPLLVWFAVSLAAAVCAPRLAGRLRWAGLRDQALRWNTVSALAVTGDLRMASEQLGAPVRTGRRWRWWLRRAMPSRAALRRVGPTALLALRDLLGVARTPARSLAAFVGTLGAGSVIGAGLVAAAGFRSPGVAAALGAIALVLVYAAIGPWCRGLRAAAETLGGMRLLPFSPAGLLLRHSVLPLLLTIPCTGASAAISAIPGGDPAASFASGAIAGLLGFGLRLLGALKGPLPQRLLAPVPTPAGDMSGINVMLWSFDGVVWALLIGAGCGALAAVAPLGALSAVGIALVLLGVGVSARLRSLSGILRLA